MPGGSGTRRGRRVGVGRRGLQSKAWAAEGGDGAADDMTCIGGKTETVWVTKKEALGGWGSASQIANEK